MNEPSFLNSGVKPTNTPHRHSKSSPEIALPQQLFAPGASTISALYIHIPFCFHKCHYCDFYSLVDDPTKTGDRQPLFLQALCRELRLRAGQTALRPRTLFIGGGTPTFLRIDLWEQFLQELRELHILDHLEEFTVEANPETVTAPLLQLLRDAGVNRLSMGAQSFQPGLLKMLERWHDPRNVGHAVALARAAGFTRINLDLIFATPGQTLDMLEDDLTQALALQPDHLSCYGLTYEPQTALFHRLQQGLVQRTEEDLELAMYAQVIARLAAARFEHYEISNWAAPPGNRSNKSLTPSANPKSKIQNPKSPTSPDNRCLHNMLYWTNAHWLGCGPSAASHVQGWRWKNEPHLGHYLDHTAAHAGLPPIMDIEHLPPDRRIGEQLMLGLRLREGLEISWLDQHIPPHHPRRAVLAELLALDMLAYSPTHLHLTARGLPVADTVIAKLL